MSQERQENVLETISAILHLGNIQFVEDNNVAEVENPTGRLSRNLSPEHVSKNPPPLGASSCVIHPNRMRPPQSQGFLRFGYRIDVQYWSKFNTLTELRLAKDKKF